MESAGYYTNCKKTDGICEGICDGEVRTSLPSLRPHPPRSVPFSHRVALSVD
uniref:Uncharacterized protein n=1 Tax=Aegilops tauschii subsp. strangulata TaxID=200361 RepID=A0A453P0B2_AEGTS